MRPPLAESHVLITGASSGIGLELARQLAPRARAMTLVARRADRLNALADELRGRKPGLEVTVHAVDLVDAAATQAMLDALPPVDILINNAGMGDFGSYERSSWDKTRRMLELNVVALAHLTRHVLGGMTARGRGGILNVSSGFGLEFMPGFAAYVGSKHFVTSFTECLRIEARARGVVVSQVCPGPVDTEFEEVAGVQPGAAPAFARMSAEKCVRLTLRAFARGKAIIVPGLVMKFAMLVGALSPRWMKRLVYRPFAGKVRKWEERKQLTASSSG